jgi:inosine-uridine nucleoside N-ribohydrolase
VHDSCAVAAVAYPELFKRVRVRVDVETEGRVTRGATVADWKGHWGQPPQTDVLVGVDEEAFARVYTEAIRRIGFRYGEGGSWVAGPALAAETGAAVACDPAGF